MTVSMGDFDEAVYKVDEETDGNIESLTTEEFIESSLFKCRGSSQQ